MYAGLQCIKPHHGCTALPCKQHWPKAAGRLLLPCCCLGEAHTPTSDKPRPPEPSQHMDTVCAHSNRTLETRMGSITNAAIITITPTKQLCHAIIMLPPTGRYLEPAVASGPQVRPRRTPYQNSFYGNGAMQRALFLGVLTSTNAHLKRCSAISLPYATTPSPTEQGANRPQQWHLSPACSVPLHPVPSAKRAPQYGAAPGLR